MISGTLKASNFCFWAPWIAYLLLGPSISARTPRRILDSLRGPPPDTGFEALMCGPCATKMAEEGSSVRPRDRKGHLWGGGGGGRNPAWQVSNICKIYRKGPQRASTNMLQESGQLACERRAAEGRPCGITDAEQCPPTGGRMPPWPLDYPFLQVSFQSPWPSFCAWISDDYFSPSSP